MSDANAERAAPVAEKPVSDGAIYAAASRKNCPDHLIDEAITRALQGEPGAEDVIKHPCELDRERLADWFKTNGVL